MIYVPKLVNYFLTAAFKAAVVFWSWGAIALSFVKKWVKKIAIGRTVAHEIRC